MKSLSKEDYIIDHAIIQGTHGVTPTCHSHNPRNTWNNSHMPQQTKVIAGSTEEY
jgi:hypothetical protein